VSRSPAAKIDTAERRARVIELRRQGLTFAEIGHECGFSTQRAHEVYLEALKAIPAREVDQYRAEALDLIHAAIEDLLPIARDHTQPRTSVEAWSQLRAWLERLAKTTGSDASTKIDATVAGTPQRSAELQDLLREAAELAAAEPPRPPAE
jgi:hypothetical protein